MENGLETQRHGIARELVSAAVAEMVKLAVGLAFMLPVIFVLSRIFSYGRPEEEISFLTFLRRLPSDAQGFPILDRLWPAIGVSASLVAGALLVSVPISGLLGWLAAVRPKWAPVRIAATVISCVPVFAFGRLFLARHTWPFLPALALGLGDLALSMIANHVYSEMTLELRRPYLRTARAKGAAPWRHYWRKLAVEIISSIKPRIPFLVGGAIVVECIFNRYGLGRMAFDAVKGATADLNVLIWICAVSVIFVRAISVVERAAKNSLVKARPPEQLEDAPCQIAAQEAAGAAEVSPGFCRDEVADVARLPKKILTRNPKTLRGELGFALRGLLFFVRQQMTHVHRFLGSVPAARFQFTVSIFFWVLALILLGFCVSGWTPYEPGAMRFESNTGPSYMHLLGTDGQERDVLTEILAAGSKLVVPCGMALLVPVLLGVPLGAYCGFEPDSFLARLTQHAADLMDAIPKLIIVLMAYVFIDVEDYLYKILPVIGFTFTPLIYYHVRERVALLRESGFVESARMLGVSSRRIILVHLLFNNCRSVVLVHGSHILGNVILMDAAMDYLQLGQPAYYTWGALFYSQLTHAQQSPDPSNALAYIAPLAAIVVSTCAFVLLSDFLRGIMEHPELSV